MAMDLYGQFVGLLGGGLSPREPVSATRLETTELPAYRRERVILQAGNRLIPQYILYPKVDGRLPAILAHHQHAGEYHLGKSEVVGIAGNPSMRYAAHLAEHGYVVAAWDALGFEERNNPLFGRSYEHFLAGQALAEGACLEREYILDTMYVTDYLLTLPEVNPKAIGTIGHSLGGQNALFTLLADERVTVGVASCGIGTVRSFIEDSIVHNPAWYLPGILKIGDTPALAPLLAGKSLFISQGASDAIFPLRGVLAFAEAAKIHANVKLHVFEGGHSFPPEAQRMAWEFFDEYLSAQV